MPLRIIIIKECAKTTLTFEFHKKSSKMTFLKFQKSAEMTIFMCIFENPQKWHCSLCFENSSKTTINFLKQFWKKKQ